MHSAPTVSFPVGRSRDAGRLLLGLWAMGAASAGLAIFQLDAMGARAALLALSVLCTGGACWWLGQRTAPGDLRFDGQHWSLSGQRRALPAGRAQVGLDLQFLMLVLLVAPEGPGQWLWLERRANPARWPALRRAVYSRAPATSTVGAPADAATLGVPPSLR
jgi:toxin CptA